MSHVCKSAVIVFGVLLSQRALADGECVPATVFSNGHKTVQVCVDLTKPKRSQRLQGTIQGDAHGLPVWVDRTASDLGWHVNASHVARTLAHVGEAFKVTTRPETLHQDAVRVSLTGMPPAVGSEARRLRSARDKLCTDAVTARDAACFAEFCSEPGHAAASKSHALVELEHRIAKRCGLVVQECRRSSQCHEDYKTVVKKSKQQYLHAAAASFMAQLGEKPVDAATLFDAKVSLERYTTLVQEAGEDEDVVARRNMALQKVTTANELVRRQLKKRVQASRNLAVPGIFIEIVMKRQDQSG